MASRYKHDWSVVNAMRAAFEGDASVTYAAIAEAAGMGLRQIANYARREGWGRSPSVHREAMRRASAIGLKSRHGAARAFAASFVGPPRPLKSQVFAPPPPAPDRPMPANMTVTSIFDLGSGRRVTTNRNHEEIQL